LLFVGCVLCCWCVMGVVGGRWRESGDVLLIVEVYSKFRKE